MTELGYWIWFAEKRGISLNDKYALLDHIGTPYDIYFARESLYEGFDFDTSPLLDKSLYDVKRILSDCENEGIQIITKADGSYPRRLLNLYDPPLVLYYKGRLPFIDDECAIAVVGTRDCTGYGVKMAESLAYEICTAGGMIVTGLARGIDSAAARGALRADGKVVGVLGNGLDIVYPASNKGLFEDVLFRGCLISEYPPRSKPEGRHFPQRNRILSGLSAGVVIVEAPERSGALITASLALDQGKDIYAVPGNADSRTSAGTNGLLRDGATPALSGIDIINDFLTRFPDKLSLRKEPFPLSKEAEERLVREETPGDKPREKAKNSKKPEKNRVDKARGEDYIEISVGPGTLSPEELAVIKAITEPNTHIDAVIRKSGLSAADVTATLTMLEINGYVSQSPGKYFTAHIKVSEA